MKVFDDFFKNKIEFYNFKGLSDEKKDNFIFENELLKSQLKDNFTDNKIDNLNNEKFKNNKNKLKRNNKIFNKENINKLPEIDNIKDFYKDIDLNKTKEKNNTNELEQSKELDNIKKIYSEEIYNIDEDILYNLSLILDIPKETIKKTIEDLDINIKDLKDNNNLVFFLEKVFDVDDSVDLLSINEIPEIIKDISEIITNKEENNHYNVLELNKKEINELNTKVISNLNKKNLETESTYYDKEKIEKSEIINIDIEPELKIQYIDQENKNLFNNTEKEKESENTPYNNKIDKLLLENDKNNIIKEVSLSNFNIDNKYIQNIEEETLNFTLDKKMDKIKSADIINQITDKLKNNFKLEISELKIKLKPEQLGEVTLKVSTEKGIITAEFITESNKIKEIIESKFNELKDLLNKEGVNVSQLSVSVEDENKNNYMKEFLKEKEKSKEKVKKIIENTIKIEEEVEKNIDQIKSENISKNIIDFTA